MTKITIERQMLLPCPFCGDDGDKGRQEVTQMIEGRNKFARITCRACGAMCPEENWNRRAALAAQPAEPAYTHADVAEAHAKGYALGLRQVDRPHPTDAQPTGQSPCARHCEAPAFEGEIRRLKREATIKDSLTIRPPAPAAVPLTDGQLSTLWDNHVVPVFGKNGINPIVFARAIERAHGIAAAGGKT